jgi:hypothetical protein
VRPQTSPPANAGAHSSTGTTFDLWIPAFAGNVELPFEGKRLKSPNSFTVRFSGQVFSKAWSAPRDGGHCLYDQQVRPACKK